MKAMRLVASLITLIASVVSLVERDLQLALLFLIVSILNHRD